MFALIESDHRPAFGWPGKLTSLALHGGLVLAAAALTRVTPVAPAHRSDTSLVWVTSPQSRPSAPAPSPASLVPPGVTLPRVIPPIVAPVVTPGEIPPPGSLAVTGLSFDTLATVRPGGTPGTTLSPETVRDVRVVDEAPVLVSHPPVRYPEALRLAGIEGRVMVETVLDTLGRAEPSATRVTQSAAVPFDREAMAVVLASRYQPARVNGRAVRVRIAVPVNFQIR